MRRVMCAILAVLGSLATSGCWFGKKQPKAQTPAARKQDPRVTQASRPSPPAAKPVTKRRPTTSAPRAVQPAAVPPKAAETKKTAPVQRSEESQRFGQILSVDETTEYRSVYERNSSAAREMLLILSSRKLTPDRMESVARIRSFLAQAQEAARSDMAKAAQLAYRAQVLARDLVRMLE